MYTLGNEPAAKIREGKGRRRGKARGGGGELGLEALENLVS